MEEGRGGGKGEERGGMEETEVVTQMVNIINIALQCTQSLM